jgi:hypothetical protein
MARVLMKITLTRKSYAYDHAKLRQVGLLHYLLHLTGGPGFRELTLAPTKKSWIFY